MTIKSGKNLQKKTKKISSIRKKNKRELKPYPNLDPSVNLKSRTDLLDYDYLHKLSKEELEFLNKFTGEYVNASINKEDKTTLHRTKRLRKNCYDMNNARNRDITTKTKMLNKLDGLEKAKHVGYTEEDRLNASLDIHFEMERRKKDTN